MKYNVTLNEYGYIDSFATVGEVLGGFECEIPDDVEISSVRIIDGKIDYKPIPDLGKKRITFLNPIYDGNNWIERGGTMDDVEFRYREIVSIIKVIKDDNMIGVISDKDLQTSIEYAKSLHPINCDAKKYIEPPIVVFKYLK